MSLGKRQTKQKQKAAKQTLTVIILTGDFDQTPDVNNHILAPNQLLT